MLACNGMHPGGLHLMASTFQRAYPPAMPAPGPAFWLPFRGSELLVRESERGINLLQLDEDGIAVLQPRDMLHVGTIAGTGCIACEVSAEQPVPQGWRALGLRALFGQIDETAYGA